MRLSVLVCTVPGREEKLARLLTVLEPQAPPNVEVLVLRDAMRRSVGSKRNAMIAIARGDYVSFVDDDDMVTPTYVSKILAATTGDPDVVCFDVWVTGYQTRGLHDRVCRYDPKYVHQNLPNEYHRKPNHLMAWRRAIADRYPFDDVSFNEDDTRGARMAHEAKRVGRIPEVLYTYQFDRSDSAAERGMNGK